MFPEDFHWVNRIQSPEIPSDGSFNFWPTWLSSMLLSCFVHHLYQAKIQCEDRMIQPTLVLSEH